MCYCRSLDTAATEISTAAQYAALSARWAAEVSQVVSQVVSQSVKHQAVGIQLECTSSPFAVSHRKTKRQGMTNIYELKA